MANNIMEYKGYQAEVEFDVDDGLLYGKVMDINDSIIFEIERQSMAMDTFIKVIDEYLTFCDENNKEPAKPYKGVFNVRISSVLHRQAVQQSRRDGITLNAFVEKAIVNAVENRL